MKKYFFYAFTITFFTFSYSSAADSFEDSMKIFLNRATVKEMESFKNFLAEYNEQGRELLKKYESLFESQEDRFFGDFFGNLLSITTTAFLPLSILGASRGMYIMKFVEEFMKLGFLYGIGRSSIFFSTLPVSNEKIGSMYFLNTIVPLFSFFLAKYFEGKYSKLSTLFRYGYIHQFKYDVLLFFALLYMRFKQLTPKAYNDLLKHFSEESEELHDALIPFLEKHISSQTI